MNRLPRSLARRLLPAGALSLLLGGGLLVGLWLEPLRFLALASGRPGALGRWAEAGAPRLAPPRELILPTRHGPVGAAVLEPREGAQETLLLCPGVHSAGIREPRLLAFGRALARSGRRVVLVAPPDLTRFHITPASTDVIEDAARWVASDARLCPSGRVGLAGISFSGGLSLVAAGRPGLRGRLAWVLSLGGHGDLAQVMRDLSASGRPLHDYGAAVIVLNVADRLVPPGQVEPLTAGVRAFLEASALDSTDHAAARPLFGRAKALEDGLPEPARGILARVNARDVRALGGLLRPVLADLPADANLSPALVPHPGVPVFLLHGAGDVVVPPSQAQDLARRWDPQGPTRVLVTPLIGHAEAANLPGLREQGRLLAFWKELLSR